METAAPSLCCGLNLPTYKPWSGIPEYCQSPSVPATTTGGKRRLRREPAEERRSGQYAAVDSMHGEGRFLRLEILAETSL